MNMQSSSSISGYQRISQFQPLNNPTVQNVLGRSLSLSVSLVLLLLGSANAATTPTGETVKQGSTSSDPTTPLPTPSSTATPGVTQGVRFACQTMNGQPTVMYYPESQPNQAYPWAVPGQLGGGWTADRRCAEISRRLEAYRPDGLQELRTGTENGYNVICATTQRDTACRIVLTVPPGQDPVLTRDRVFENLSVADSGQQTDGVATFSGDDAADLINQIGGILNLPGRRQQDTGINLRPFLDRADGGTGEHLRDNGTPATPARLDPDRFR